MSYTTHNINPKPCAYGCSIQIYWTTSANEYWNIFTKKKHICPNRRQKSATTTTTTTTTTIATTTAAGITPPSTTSKPHYYNLTVTKRTPYTSFPNQQPKPKLSHSFELLTTSPKENIQKQYEMLSDIVTEHGRRVHSSQRDIDSKTGLMDLIIYYEVPQGQREEVKQKFNNIRNEIVTSYRNEFL
jgi:hypothetical protein